MTVQINNSPDLKNILFSTLDDFMNGKISAFEAKTIANLAKQAVRIQKNEIKQKYIKE